MQANLTTFQIISLVISVVVFILALFQIIVSQQANIRQTKWELGVLRSMGVT